MRFWDRSGRRRSQARRLLHRSDGWLRADALVAHQRAIQPVDATADDHARRPFRCRTNHTQSHWWLFQLQRHCRYLAATGDRDERRLAARHAHRRHRSEFSRAVDGMEICLPARRGSACGNSGRDKCVQGATATLGQRRDAGWSETLSAHLAGATSVTREAGNVFPFDRQHQLSADDRRELLAVPVIAGALQPAVLSPDGFGSAAAVLFVDLGGAVLWFGGLVSRREAHAATVTPAARDGTWNRTCVFKRARSAGDR